MNFQKLRKPKPPRIVALPEGYFKEGCESPLPGTRVGIKRLSVGYLQYCYDQAEMYKEEGIKSHNLALMINVVARALTLPDDVSKPLLKAGDIEARFMFTSEGLEYLYDIILQLQLSTSPIYEELSDPQIDALIELLKKKKIPSKLRRLLAYVYDCLCQLSQ